MPSYRSKQTLIVKKNENMHTKICICFFSSISKLYLLIYLAIAETVVCMSINNIESIKQIAQKPTGYGTSKTTSERDLVPEEAEIHEHPMTPK